MARPSWPFAANVGSPEYANLVAWCPYPQAGTSVLHDLIGGTDLTLINGAGPVSTPAGTALDCAANDRGARITAPSYVKGLNPLTLVWIGTGASSPDAFSYIYVVTYDNADGSPYVMAGFGWDASAAKIRGMHTDSGGSFREFSTASNVTLDSGIHMIVLVVQNGSQALYVDGAANGTGTQSFNGGSSTGSSQWCVGAGATNLSRNSKTTCYDVRVYDRAWSGSDVTAAWNSGDPWGLYEPVAPTEARLTRVTRTALGTGADPVARLTRVRRTALGAGAEPVARLTTVRRSVLGRPRQITFPNGQLLIGLTWWELTTPAASEPQPYTDRPLPDPRHYYRGWKEPRVRRWGRIQHSLSGFDGQYESATFDMSHVDTDRALRALDDADDLVNGAGVVRMITDDGRRALQTPRVVYRGLVKDIGPEPDLAYKVTLKDPFVDAFQVTGNAPTIPSRRVVDDDFPNCGVTLIASSASGYQTSASAIVGADTVSIDTGTGLFASGDRFTFAGHATVYTASTSYAATSLSFTPPLTDAVGDNEAITVLASHTIESARGKCVPIVYGHITDHNVIDSIDVGDGQGPVIYVGDRTLGGNVWAEFLWAGHACYGGPGSPSGAPFQHLYFWNHNLDDLAGGTFYKDGIELTTLSLTDLATEAGSGGRIAIPGYANWTDLGFTTSYADINGRRYTRLFLSGLYRDWALGILEPPDNLGGVPFSVDAYGCEDVGNGTGALIQNGLLQYLHTIVNWCPPQGDSYQSGAWLSIPAYPDGTPMIHAGSFATADAVSTMYVVDSFRGDFILGANNEGIAPRDLIARFNQSFGVDAGFNRDTQFFVNLITRDESAIALASPLGWERDIFAGQFAIESRTRERYASIRYRHTKDYVGRTTEGWRLIAAGSSPDLQMFMVRGKNRDTDPDEYTRGSETVAAVVALKLARYQAVQHIATLQTGPAGFSYDVGDVVPITHYQGVGSAGWIDVPCRIERLEIDPSTYTTTLELYDLRPVFT